MVSAHRGLGGLRNAKISDVLALQSQGDEEMLGTLAAILIVLWLLGFFAFHVTTSFIHVALILGLILLVWHFMKRGTATA